MNKTLQAVQTHLHTGGHLWLFLDYDGTLVPIARTPDEAQPDAALLYLLARIARTESIDLTIISGRPLASLRTMLRMPGITLAGTYGIEVRKRNATIVRRVDPTRIRPKILKIKSAWRKLIAKRSGFLLEDKGLSIALHARFAKPSERAVVIPSAEVIARMAVRPTNFRVLADVDFLEVAPTLAHKGKAVEWLLGQRKLQSEMLVYFGDDDKDEEAFEVVRQIGGIPVRVGKFLSTSKAKEQLASSKDVRVWLGRFLEASRETP
ncbi:MAG: trehalose-phosphatase [Chloroflexi bacterium]|nr:trehalose-phosphatase [Chloroflexota bacterium]